MRNSIFASIIASLFYFMPLLGYADEIKVNGTEESFEQFANRLILMETPRVFDVERPTNLGVIEVSVDLWKFEILSSIPAYKKMNKQIADWQKPYELDIFLGFVHHPVVTKAKPGILPAIQYPPRAITADIGSRERVTIGRMTVKASLYFKTREVLFKFLTEELYPIVDKKIVVSGTIVPGGMNWGRDKNTTSLEVKVEVPINIHGINGKSYTSYR